MFFRNRAALSGLLLAVGSSLSFGQVNVLTYHNDNARSGQNTSETTLTPASVNASKFGKLFSFPVDGKVDAEPLYVAAKPIPGQGTHNVVYAATEHDSLYAFDANSGKLFWHVSLLKSGESPSDSRGCNQITPEIGITATPVIDLYTGPAGTIYVVAMSRDGSGNYYQRIHALNLATGAEQFGGPVTVQASYPGTGANSSGGRVIFDPKQYKARPGLLLLNGVVYTSWGSHCDIEPYTGWLIGYDRETLHQTSVFNFAPNGSEGALWNSGGGPAADSSGNIFVAVANGTFDTTLTSSGFPNRADYGNAFVKLALKSGQLQALDYWTMASTDSESGNDSDLGSGGIMLLPDQIDSNGATRHLAVGAGKDQNLYVVDRDNMGKFDAQGDATIYQQLGGALQGGIWSNPAYFDGNVYFGPVGGSMLQFELNKARLSQASATRNPFGYPGVTPSVSASGSANGIVWGVENSTPAVLHAYDPFNLSTEYYNSNQASGGRDNFGPGNKYIAPLIAGGQVFVGTTNSVAVFSLLPKSQLPNGEYAVISQFSSLVWDDPDFSSVSGTQIGQYYPNGGSNQKWYFTADGAYYTIRNVSSGLYLTDPAGSSNLGTKLEQQSASGSNAQLWSLSVSGSGYIIRNKASGLVVDDSGWSAVPTGLQLWSSLGNSNQAWILQ